MTTAQQFNDHAETFVLQAALADQWFDDIARALPQPEMFYRERNQQMYRAITALRIAAKGVDAHTIAVELRKIGGLGGAQNAQWQPEAIEHFTASTSAEVLNYEAHAEEVRAQWVRREMTTVAMKARIAAADQTTDAHDALDDAQQSLSTIAEASSRTTPADIHTIATASRSMMNENRARQHSGMIVGITSGIAALDRLTYGWIAPRFVILAAATSIGKTALLFTQANAALLDKRGVAIYSAEEEPKMLFIRLAAMRAKVNGQMAIAGVLPNAEQMALDIAMATLECEPLEIIDATGWSALDIRAHVRSTQRRMPELEFVGVDYLQKLRPIRRHRDGVRVEMAETSKALFELAHSRKLILFALAQLNRKTQSRENKRPDQSDIQECGNIEQDADSIILVHRPEYYGEDTWHIGGLPCIGEAELLVTKHRGGETKPNGIRVAFHKTWGEFADLDPDRNPPSTMPDDGRYAREW